MWLEWDRKPANPQKGEMGSEVILFQGLLLLSARAATWSIQGNASWLTND